LASSFIPNIFDNVQGEGGSEVLELTSEGEERKRQQSGCHFIEEVEVMV
jgi:hypothetical protein